MSQVKYTLFYIEEEYKELQVSDLCKQIIEKIDRKPTTPNG